MQGSGIAEARPLVGQCTLHELCDVIRNPRDSSGLFAHSGNPAQVGRVGTSMLDDWSRDVIGNIKEFSEDEARLNK